MDELWLFVVHRNGNTWTRAAVPSGVRTVQDLINYLKRGGKVVSEWMDIRPGARFIPRAVGMTVLAQLVENVSNA